MALNGAQSAGIVTTNGLSESFKALTASLASNPLFWGALAVGGIVVINKVIDHFTITVEEAAEAAEKSAESLQKTKSELESLRSELSGTQDQIDTLMNQNPNSLTIIEKKQLKDLQQANEELEKRIELQEILLNNANEEARQDALEYFNKSDYDVRYTGFDMSQVEVGNARYGTDVYDAYYGSVVDIASQRLDDYQKLVERKKELDFEMLNMQSQSDFDENSDSYTNLSLEYQAVTSNIETLKSSLSETVSEFDTLDDNLNPTEDVELINLIKSIQSLYIDIFNPKNLTPEQKVQEEIEKQASDNADALAELEEQVNDVISSYSDLNGILASQNGAQSVELTTEQLELYGSALEIVNGVMQVNSEKALAIAKAKNEEEIATLDAKKAQDQVQYLDNVKKIELYSEAIKNNSKEKIDGIEPTQLMVDALRSENEQLISNCDSYDYYMQKLRESSGEYQNWLAKQSASTSGTMYTDAQNALKAIKEAQESGKTGNGNTVYQAAMEFIIPEDVSSQGQEAINNYLTKIKTYISEDEDGLGLNTFISDSIQEGLIEDLGNGQSRIVDGTKISDFAEKLGIGETMAKAMLGQLSEYWDLNFDELLGFDDTYVQTQNVINGLNQNIELGVDVEVSQEKLNEAKEKLQELNETNFDKVSRSLQDVFNSENLNKIQSLKDEIQSLSNNGIDTSSTELELDTLINKLKELSGLSDVEITAYISYSEDQKADLQKKLEVETDPEKIASIQSQIDEIDSSLENAKQLKVEPSSETIQTENKLDEIQNYTFHDKVIKITANTSELLTKLREVETILSGLPTMPTLSTSGINKSSQNGGANAYGGVIKSSERALVGELGNEIVVDPNRGTWRTVGDNGAEFVNLPSDAIIFDHNKTQALLKQGFVNSRGLAFANGNSYLSGVGGSIVGGGGSISPAKKTSDSSDSSSDKSSSDKSDADNAIDWIERKIKILQDKRSELETLMNNTYTMYTGLTKEEVDRVTELLSSELSPDSDAVNELCDLANKAGMSIGELQQRIFDGAGFESKQSIIAGYILNDKELLKTYPQAIAQYESEYEKAIALVTDYRDKIENGSIDVESISDETTHDNVQKAIDARDKVTDTRSSYAEIQQKLNDDIILKYDTQIEQCEKINDLADKRISLINAQVDYLEEEGQILDASAYNGLIGLYKEQESTISKQIEIKKAELQELLSTGLSEDTSQYMDLNSEIVDLEAGLVNCATSQEELNNKLIQLPIDNIQKAVDLYSDMQTAIEDFGSVTEASGGTLDASYYQSLIDLGQEQIGQLEQQADAIRDAMSNYDTDNTHYIDLASQLSKVTSSIQSIVKSMYEWNEAILQLPISHLNNALGVLQGIQDKLTDTISLIEAQGGVATKGMYEDLIAGSQAQERYYVQLKDFYQQSLDYAEEDSEQYYDLVKNIQECDTNINKCNQDQVGWNKAILNIPIDVVDKYNEKLQSVIDSINDIMDDYGTTISAVTGAIDDQKQALQEANDATHDAYDARIQELQDQLDALRKVNEALQYQTDLEQALYDLEKVTNQKTVAVIINGQKQYVADADALRDAEQSVADAQEALNEYNIQSQIDDLNDMLGDIDDVYNDQIEALERISNKWSEIASKAEQTKNETLATTILGEGWKNKVLTGNDDDIFNEFVSSYNDMFSQQNNYQEQIDANNHLADQIQRYMDAYESGDMDFNQAYQAIQNATNNISSSVSSFDKLSDVLSFYNSGNLSGVLSELENSMKEANNSLQSSYSSDLDTYLPSFDGYLNQLNTEFSEALQQTIDNNNLIGTYKTTWDIVSDNISDIKDIVEEINDAVRNGSDYLEDGELENDIETANSNSSNSSSSVTDYPSGHVISGHSYTHVVTGVNGGPGVSYKDGIENGLIGSGSTKNNETKMKILGLRKLDPQEIPALMHLNEAVFNPTQQNQLLENFGRAYNAGAINAISSPTSGVNVNLNMSNLEFNEINNGQDFANFITKNLSSAIAQGLAK